RHQIRKQLLLDPAGDNQSRAIGRPFRSAAPVVQRRLSRAELLFVTAVNGRQHQQVSVASCVPANKSELVAIGRDAEVAPDSVDDSFFRTAKRRRLIDRAGLGLLAKE